DKPIELAYQDAEERRFWQGVRTQPGNSVRDVRSRFRDLDRRLSDLEVYYTSHNRRLADEIDSLR
ncbi:MAG TPA: envelope stress response membrane protein PspC, partial [Sphingomonas sp.]|nr:envelope stress response membrane protein PspC [Sphingomonas sp.]